MLNWIWKRKKEDGIFPRFFARLNRFEENNFTRLTLSRKDRKRREAVCWMALLLYGVG